VAITCAPIYTANDGSLSLKPQHTVQQHHRVNIRDARFLRGFFPFWSRHLYNMTVVLLLHVATWIRLSHIIGQTI